MRAVLMSRSLPPGLTFAPVPGTYFVGAHVWANESVVASEPVVWNWSATGNLPTSTVANGGTASSISFSLHAPGLGDKACTITLSNGLNSWTINMEAWGTGHA